MTWRSKALTRLQFSKAWADNRLLCRIHLRQWLAEQRRQANIQEEHLRHKSFQNRNVKHCCGVEKARRYFWMFSQCWERRWCKRNIPDILASHIPAHQKGTLPQKQHDTRTYTKFHALVHKYPQGWLIITLLFYFLLGCTWLATM